MAAHAPEYQAALAEIWERSDYDRGYISDPFSGGAGPETGLRRTKAVLEALGNPHQRLTIAHVAGSKGKGSTCAFLAGIARGAGYATGLYTSPHLHTFRERIAVDGSAISEASFSALARDVLQAVQDVEGSRPELGSVTSFEMLTAMALTCFEQQQSDLAVIEVGLGGTLDATNVVNPAVSVITRLDLEHTLVLGTSIEEIAANKAGIIKPGKPVVSVAQVPEAREVIEKAAEAQSSELLLEGRNWHWTGTSKDFSFHDGLRELGNLSLDMPGDHQVENAAAAIAATGPLERSGLSIPQDAIRRGLAAVSLPGRYEQTTWNQRTFILDGAHTPAASLALAATIRERHGNPLLAIVGMLRDKDPYEFLRGLSPVLRRIVAVQAASPRALPEEAIVAAATGNGIAASAAPDLKSALNLALEQSAPDDPILITGSFSLVAQAREFLGLASRDPELT